MTASSDIMTAYTEALREQFELYVNPEGDIKLHRLVDGSYAGHGLNQSWMDFQAGHAAGVAAELERCANLAESINILVRFAEGLTTHNYSGACPSDESPKSRDSQCVVCWAIDAARAAKEGGAT